MVFIAPHHVGSISDITATTKAPQKDEHQFDGASFVGGIVLCTGIVVILFFVRKWYRSRQEANYHTL